MLALTLFALFWKIHSIICLDSNIQGECLFSEYVGLQKVANVRDCIRSCESNNVCLWSTYHPSHEICLMHANCESVNDSQCPNCITNKKNFGQLQCDVKGICKVRKFEQSNF